MAAESWRDNWELAFPSEYLGAQHLHGRDVTLTISKVERPELEMFDPATNRKEKRRRFVIHFDELKNAGPDDPKFLLCNKTNAKTISLMYGKPVDGWIGQRITVYPTEIKVGGEEKQCLRIRARIPPAPAAKGTGRPPVVEEGAPARDTAASADMSPPPAGPAYADEVRAIMSDMTRALTEPEIMPSLRERILALPEDAPDRPLLEAGFKRLRKTMAAKPTGDAP